MGNIDFTAAVEGTPEADIVKVARAATAIVGAGPLLFGAMAALRAADPTVTDAHETAILAAFGMSGLAGGGDPGAALGHILYLKYQDVHVPTSAPLSDDQRENLLHFLFETAKAAIGAQAAALEAISTTTWRKPRWRTPSAPTGLSVALGEAPRTTNLTWTLQSTDECSVIVKRAWNGGQYRWELPAGTTSYADSRLSNGTLYTYKVSTSNYGGETEAVEATIETPHETPLTPYALGWGISADPAGIRIGWKVDMPQDVDRIDIYRSTTGENDSYEKIGESTTMTYVDTSPPECPVWYKVKAIGPAGESSLSAECEVMYPA